MRSWEANWEDLATMFDYPPAIRRLIYTTNTAEGYHRQLRKVTKTKGHFQVLRLRVTPYEDAMSAPMSNIRNSVRSSETKRQSLTIPTAIGLVLTLASPLLYGFLVPRFLQPSVGQVTYLLLGMLFMWLLTFSVVSITLFWERQPLMSLGVRRLSWKFMLLAVGLGVVLSLAVPVLTVLMSRILPSVHAGSIGETATRSPAWVVLLGVLTAAVTEEVVFRAYPLERFASLTGKMWPGVIISLAAFVVFHVLTGWNVAHVLGVVLPLGAILTGLYIWRRNLGFVVVTHLLIDLPLFLLALGVLPQG